jgi:hypothetical protein
MQITETNSRYSTAAHVTTHERRFQVTVITVIATVIMFEYNTWDEFQLPEATINTFSILDTFLAQQEGF